MAEGWRLDRPARHGCFEGLISGVICKKAVFGIIKNRDSVLEKQFLNVTGILVSSLLSFSKSKLNTIMDLVSTRTINPTTGSFGSEIQMCKVCVILTQYNTSQWHNGKWNRLRHVYTTNYLEEKKTPN